MFFVFPLFGGQNCDVHEVLKQIIQIVVGQAGHTRLTIDGRSAGATLIKVAVLIKPVKHL
jgi:hypothetical protein